MSRRLAAIVALVVGAATIVLAVVVAVSEFPRGLVLLGCVVVAGAAAWYGVLRRGIARVAGLAVAGLALAGAVVLLVVGRDRRRVDLLVLAGLLVTLAAARATLTRPRGPAERLGRRAAPVLFYNPKSGGGKAERFALADEARARGIEPIELKPGEDLETLVRGAVERGADGLAMAGGDGSQAIVAAIAAELGLPYACIPAGTRNHFALDLGVDRDDVVGALDAFVDGGERTVDLAEVNGRVFVNNVSLGLYAEAVQRRSIATRSCARCSTPCPTCSARTARELDLRWTGPGGQVAPRGRRGAGLQQPLPARPRDRLGDAPADRRRPARRHGHRRARRVAASAAGGRSARGASGRRRRSRSTRTGPSPAGIDGEALVLDPPLIFRIRPGVLRVRVARKHPGASPSATAPEGPWAGVRELARIAARREHTTRDITTKEARMDLMEITEKERLSREDAAARLHALADALARHNEVEFERGGLRFKVHVPDEVDFKLEIEIGDDERELEIELNVVTAADVRR